MSKSAAVWFDEHSARVFVLGPARQIHETSVADTSGGIDYSYFAAVARAVDEVADVLIVGPIAKKLEFLRYVRGHEPALAKKVVGLEMTENPTDSQVLRHAQQYFNLEVHAS